MNKNLILIFFLCASAAGCASQINPRELQNQVSGLQADILKKNEELIQKDNQLKEKDKEIAGLRKQLEGFGVFK
jgi:hypothetical protein